MAPVEAGGLHDVQAFWSGRVREVSLLIDDFVGMPDAGFRLVHRRHVQAYEQLPEVMIPRNPPMAPGDALTTAGAASLSRRLPAPAGFVEKPHTLFRLVDEILDQTGGRYIVVLVANVMALPHRCNEALIVVAQLGQHIERGHVRRIVVFQAL